MEIIFLFVGKFAQIMVVLIEHLIPALTLLTDHSGKEFIEAEDMITCHLSLENYLSSQFVSLLFES